MSAIAPYITPTFIKGQSIGLIFNKVTVLVGTIDKVNFDNTYDLTCMQPIETRKVKFHGDGTFQVIQTFALEPRPFLKAHAIDPCTVFQRQMVPLAQPMSAPRDGILQTHTDRYIATEHRLPAPRFDAWDANFVGRFFDPAQFYYRIYCYRGPREIAKDQFTPEVVRFYPDPLKRPYYEHYSDCFNRYFKEAMQRLNKWDTIRVEAINPKSLEIIAQ